MMSAFKMFCKIICQIFLAWVPLNVKVSVFDLVGYPEESHLHGSGSMFFNCVIGDSSCSLVVTMDMSWWLWVAKFLEDEADNFAFLAVEEECA